VPASGDVTGLGDAALAGIAPAPSIGGLTGALGAAAAPAGAASLAGADFCGCEDFLTKGVCSFPFFEKLEQAARKIVREKMFFVS
jgi:hypothetical protein